MLTSAEITAMQATCESVMTATAVISRYTATPDGQGGQVQTWANVGTANCHVSPAGQGSERDLAARPAIVSPWVVTMPHDTNVTPKDRIVTGGRTLEVAAVLAPRTWQLALRVICSEVT